MHSLAVQVLLVDMVTTNKVQQLLRLSIKQDMN